MRFSSRTILILGISSDIGKALALQYLAQGARVFGTYRTRNHLSKLEPSNSLKLFPCDIENQSDLARLVRDFRDLGWKWDTFISTVGSEQPIGLFFNCDFNKWENSIRANLTGQLHVLHQVHSLRETPMAHVVFFAGPGTNNSAPFYSAMCLSKIALIKMCELLDSENADLNVFAVGPGWVRSKIHQQTLDHPEIGENYHKTKAFVENGTPGTGVDKIFEHIEWLVSCGKGVASGRNFSTVNDSWGTSALKQALSSDPEIYKLKRNQNNWKP